MAKHRVLLVRQYILEQLKNNKKVTLVGFGQRAEIVFVTGDDLLSSHYEVQIGGNNAWSIRYSKQLPQDPTQAGLVFRNLLEQIIRNNEVYHREYDTNSKMLETMPKGDAPFAKQKELDEAIAKQKELDAEYNKLGQTEEDKTKFRLLEDDDMEHVDERFNHELARYQNGEMDKSEMLHLGKPQGVMRAFLPDLPIVMRQRVIKKGSEKKHEVDVSAIMNMPQHLSSPIFVFQRNEDTIGVLTDMRDRNGKNVCVAIELKRQIQQGAEYLEVNDVRSFHGREIKNIVEPIAGQRIFPVGPLTNYE